jgi:uncharacterized membrane protein YfhO
MRKTNQRAVYFAAYTIVFAVLSLLAFAPFLWSGRDLLWRTDGITQYYPKAVYFARYIRELLANFAKGDFTLPMYDFSIGMGSTVTYSLEPLYFLFALFGEDHIQLAYTVITLLRFYLAGITVSVLLLYFGKDFISTLIASAVYIFGGFALYGGARHTMFMIPMILLPLLILAIEEIIRERRWYLCTILVAVSLFCNYYYLYMNTIAMGIYFLVRFFCQKDRTKRSFWRFLQRGLVISGSYLLGVAMAGIVLVTTFGLYVHSGRSGSSGIALSSLLTYDKEWPMRCFLSFLTTANSPGNWMKLGFLPIALLAVTVLFVRRGRKELKLLTVIGMILMMTPLAAYVFSGFDSVINRWCYMLALLVAYIVADVLPDLYRMRRREWAACIGITLLYGAMAFFGSWMSTIYTKLAFAFLVLTLLVLLIAQERFPRVPRAAKQGLMLVLTAGLVFYNGYSLFEMEGAAQEYTKWDRADAKAGNTPLAALEELEDTSFYRAAALKLDYLTISSSLMLGYNGITQFSSTINGVITEYLEELGATSYSVTQMLGFSNRVFLNALASVKYCAYYDGVNKTVPYGYEEVLHTTANGQETTVCENQYALPLGYTYSEAISEEELEQYSAVERQEVMLQKVVLNDGEAEGQGSEISLTSTRLALTETKEKGITLTDQSLTASKKKGRLTLYFDGQANAETYLVLKNAVVQDSSDSITLTFQTDGNSIEYRFRAADDRYRTGQEDYVINLGYHEEPITSCKITTNRTGTIAFDSIELYSQSMENLEQYTTALTETVLEDVEQTTNTITGTITLDEDKYLVLSIPYQNGWTAYVDGEETQLQRANYMYMALSLGSGTHTIQLRYEIPGVKGALILMGVSTVVFLLLCYYTARRRRR